MILHRVLFVVGSSAAITFKESRICGDSRLFPLRKVEAFVRESDSIRVQYTGLFDSEMTSDYQFISNDTFQIDNVTLFWDIESQSAISLDGSTVLSASFCDSPISPVCLYAGNSIIPELMIIPKEKTAELIWPKASNDLADHQFILNYTSIVLYDGTVVKLDAGGLSLGFAKGKLRMSSSGCNGEYIEMLYRDTKALEKVTCINAKGEKINFFKNFKYSLNSAEGVISAWEPILYIPGKKMSMKVLGFGKLDFEFDANIVRYNPYFRTGIRCRFYLGHESDKRYSL